MKKQAKPLGEMTWQEKYEMADDRADDLARELRHVRRASSAVAVALRDALTHLQIANKAGVQAKLRGLDALAEWENK